MNAPTKLRMDADEFIRWAMEQPEGTRYELANGEIYPMSPERFGHIEAKGNVYFSLRSALRSCRQSCYVYTDGVSVRIDDDTVYEPDAMVRCGEPMPPDAVEARDPIIVVEVLSPSTQALDTGAKLIGYFELPSLRHYLVVHVKARHVIHHERGEDGRIAVRFVSSGALTLDPPGLTLNAEQFFSD